MKKYAKLLIVLALILVILLGVNLFVSSNPISNGEKIADTVIGFYDDLYYDRNQFNQNEQEVLDLYVSKLMGGNYTINISDYIEQEGYEETTEPNSKGVYKIDNICYVDLDDLVFVDSSHLGEGATDDQAIAICDGKLVAFWKAHYVFDYNEIRDNPVHDYRYVGYVETSDVVKYFYKSYYNSSVVSVNLFYEGDLKEVTVTNENISNYNIIEAK